MMVRASAGAASFRRQPTLEEALTEAEEQLRQLKEELDTDPAAGKTRQQAARVRAAEERAWIRAALEQLPKIAESKKAKDREKRAGLDDGCRRPRHEDGRRWFSSGLQRAVRHGCRLASHHRRDVVNSGGDQGKLAPMVEQHQERYSETPKKALIDGGFVKKADIDQLSPPQGGTTVYAPVMESKDPNRDPHTPREDDSPAVAEWRQRMATDEAKAIYRQRACYGGVRERLGPKPRPGTAVPGPRSAEGEGRGSMVCLGP